MMWEFGNFILYQTLESDESHVHVRDLNRPIAEVVIANYAI